uniref:Uncharacterized protein n=1 Tax=Brassica campestris TaxID=3711 RepID=M4FI79_BRACM
MYPADECQSLLKHQQVHLRRNVHHWEKPTWVTRAAISGSMAASGLQKRPSGPNNISGFRNSTKVPFDPRILPLNLRVPKRDLLSLQKNSRVTYLRKVEQYQDFPKDSWTTQRKTLLQKSYLAINESLPDEDELESKRYTGRRDMRDVNADDVPTQADINAQLLAGQAQLTATMNAVTEHLARLEQRNRPNDPRPRRRNHPYLDEHGSCPSRVGPLCLGLVDFSLSKRVHVVFASSPLEGHSCRFACEANLERALNLIKFSSPNLWRFFIPFHPTIRP